MKLMKHARATFFNIVEISSKVIEIRRKPSIMTLIIQMKRDCATNLHTYHMMNGGGSLTFGAHLRQR